MAQWVKDPVLGHSCGMDLLPGLGNSACHSNGQGKKKKKERKGQALRAGSPRERLDCPHGCWGAGEVAARTWGLVPKQY